MALTVREVMQIWPVDQGRLVGGADGLDRPVTWVHVVEVFDDPYFFAPEILLCSTGYGLKDDHGLQRSVMQHAHESRVGAILLKTGYELERVPDSLIALADEYGIPLFRFPQGISFADVSRALGARVLDRDVTIVKRSQSLFRRLLDAQLAHKGPDELVRILRDTLGVTTFITNRRGELRAVAYTDRSGTGNGPASPGSVAPPEATVLTHMRHYTQRLGSARGLERLFDLNTILAVPGSVGGGHDSTLRAFLAPIRYEHRLRGVVGMVADRSANDLDLWALECAATVASIEFYGHRVTEATERRLAGSVLEALASTDRTREAATIARRLTAWGYDVDAPARVVMIECDLPAGTSQRTLLHARHVVDLYCPADSYTPLVELDDDRATLLKQLATGSDADQERLTLDDLSHQASAGLRGAPVWVGASRPFRPSHSIPPAFEEARRALSVARALRPEGGVVIADDLGLDNLLLDVADSARALAYAEGVLGPIVEHDKGGDRGRLASTLETYLAMDCDPRRAAEALFLHPNTVRYRIRTIEGLTGRSLLATETRVIFGVALRVLRLAGRLKDGGADPGRTS